MWWYFRELFLSSFLLFTCIFTHNLQKVEQGISRRPEMGKRNIRAKEAHYQTDEGNCSPVVLQVHCGFAVGLLSTCIVKNIIPCIGERIERGNLGIAIWDPLLWWRPVLLCCDILLLCCDISWWLGRGRSGGRSSVGYVILKLMGISTSGTHNDVGYFSNG